MRRIRIAALCLSAAMALSVFTTGCSFFQGESADSASASSSSAAEGEPSLLKPASEYEYENFDYSAGLDENGLWEGVTALDYVTLPEDYAAISVALADVAPTEDEIQEQLDYLLYQNRYSLEIVGRPAAEGDTVRLDYVGSVNGVVFNGGSAEDYELVLGSDTFIDGFEDQVVGHNTGDTFTITLTFPEGYSDTTDAEGNTIALSGQEATFEVTLKAILTSVLPELTDEWVDATFGTTDDVHTVDELRQTIYDLYYQSDLGTALLNYLLTNSTFKEIPEVVLDYQVESCLNYYYQAAQTYGYTLEEFLPLYTGYESADALLADMESDLISYCEESLIYQAVAEAMGMSVSADAYTAYSSDYLTQYGQNYLQMVALMDQVTTALQEGAQVA